MHTINVCNQPYLKRATCSTYKRTTHYAFECFLSLFLVFLVHFFIIRILFIVMFHFVFLSFFVVPLLFSSLCFFFFHFNLSYVFHLLFINVFRFASLFVGPQQVPHVWHEHMTTPNIFYGKLSDKGQPYLSSMETNLVLGNDFDRCAGRIFSRTQATLASRAHENSAPARDAFLWPHIDRALLPSLFPTAHLHPLPPASSLFHARVFFFLPPRSAAGVVTYVVGSSHHRTPVVANSVAGGSFSHCRLQQIRNLRRRPHFRCLCVCNKNGKSFNQCIKKIHPMSEKASMAMEKSFNQIYENLQAVNAMAECYNR